jgi:hypothetical protein
MKESEERKKKARLLQARILYKYLKRNNCIADFVTNVLEYEHGMDNPRVKNLREFNKSNILNVLANIGTICQAFSWAGTHQGDVYWRRLDDEFWRFKTPIINSMRVLDPNLPTVCH